MKISKNVFIAICLTFTNTVCISLFIPVLPLILRSWSMPDFYYGIVLAIYSFAQFISSPVLGVTSDRYGFSKPLIVTHVIGLFTWIGFIGLWYFDTYVPTNVVILFISLILLRVIGGAIGGNNAIVQSIIANVEQPDLRIKYFGYTSAAMGVGMLVGPAIGGYTLASSYGYGLSVLVALLINILALLLIALFLEKETPSVNSIKHSIRIRAAFETLSRKVFSKCPKIVQNIIVVYLGLTAIMSAYISIIILFLFDSLMMSQTEVGNFLMLVGGLAVFNQSVMVMPVIKRFGELNSVYLSLALLLIGLVALPNVQSYYSLVPCYYLINLGISIAIPTLKGVASKFTAKQMQGSMVGTLESMQALSFSLVPIMSTFVYAFIGAHAFYIWAGLVILVVIFLSIQCRPKLTIDDAVIDGSIKRDIAG